MTKEASTAPTRRVSLSSLGVPRGPVKFSVGAIRRFVQMDPAKASAQIMRRSLPGRPKKDEKDHRDALIAYVQNVQRSPAAKRAWMTLSAPGKPAAGKRFSLSAALGGQSQQDIANAMPKSRKKVAETANKTSASPRKAKKIAAKTAKTAAVAPTKARAKTKAIGKAATAAEMKQTARKDLLSLVKRCISLIKNGDDKGARKAVGDAYASVVSKKKKAVRAAKTTREAILEQDKEVEKLVKRTRARSKISPPKRLSAEDYDEMIYPETGSHPREEAEVCAQEEESVAS